MIFKEKAPLYATEIERRQGEIVLYVTYLSSPFVPSIADNASIFRPDILPNFTFTRLVAQLPADAQLINQYEIKNDYETATVTILKRMTDPKYTYHVMPPEYSLSEEHHMLLNLARSVLEEHRPKAEEFTDIERTRQVFLNIS